MVKSPEQYLSGLSFSLPDEEEGHADLNASERAFVEKYLGMDMFQKMPELAPEPLLKAAPLPQPQKPLALMDRPIIVAPSKVEARTSTVAPAVRTAAPVIEVAPAAVIKPVADKNEALVSETAAAPVTEITVESTAPADEQKVEAAPEQQVAEGFEQKIITSEESAAETVAVAEETPQRRLSMRDRLREETEIQMVSFFVSGQLFLLPVPEIQEVLRHMELVKVPQAPPFVAGAINLRGRVMPLIHLSSLLTNEPVPAYTEKNFIIVCGSDDLQLGLIIDKISSMHMVPQAKIIWNVESMLGDAAEIICAVANLDDKVTGIVEPDMITRKLLAN